MPMPETSSSSRAALLTLVAVLLGGLGWWLWPRDASEEPDASSPSADASPLAPRRRADAGDAPEDPLALRHAAKASITGTVRSRERGPLADAQVCAWAVEDQLRGLAAATPTCVRSDREGRYRIEGLWPVRTQISASAAEHRPQQWQTEADRVRLSFVSLAAGRTREGIDFELEGGGVQLSGVVRDLGGGEIEGALVATQELWSDYAGTGRAFALSDAEGRFALWVAPGEVELIARAEGYALATTRPHAPTAMAEIFMTPESVLVGQVVDAASGEPLPDVLVAIGRGVADTRSDAEGHFRFGKLGPGVYKPIVRDDELFGVVDVKVHLGLAQTSEPIVIRAHRMAAVRGMVVIAEGERPCPRGNVALRQLVDRSVRYSAPIEDGGQVTLRGVEPGTYEVSLGCTNFLAREEYPQLVVGHESLDGLVWAVDEGQAIRGRVVDASGAGVGKASVSARPIVEGEQARAHTSSSSAETKGDDGSFELRGLLPGRYELSVSSDEPAPELPLVVELPSGRDLSDVRIELLASGRIVGRVVDESGVPQPGVDVSAKPLGKWGGGSTRSDDEGHFVLEHLRRGEVRVRAGMGWDDMRAPGTSDDDVQGELVKVEAGKQVEVELVIESRNGVIRGRVLDEQGAPVDDAFISAERMSDSATASASISRSMVRWGAFGRETPILSEVDGSFTIERLSAGRYVVRAHRRGGGEALLEGVELGSSVELTIAATGSLGGRLVVPGGEPPERFSIRVEDTKQGISEGDLFFRSQGQWQLDELPPGSYRVTASGQAGTASIDVELAAGERRDDLELELEPLVTLRGRLVDIDTREPVPGMIVAVGRGITMGRGNAGDNEISDAEGRFEVEQAATGKVTISIRPRNVSSSTRYGWTSFARELASEPSVQDLGDVELVASRVTPDQAAGTLGFELAQNELGTAPEQMRMRVGLIRPGGPAAATALAVGDEIEQVDGKSVSGVDSMRFYTLTQVPPGTTIVLTIAGGKQVSITAGPPLE
jgi:hypothetical protein